MLFMARLALRSALLAGRAGVDATKAVPAATVCILPGRAVTRCWLATSAPSEDAMRKAEKMVELMGQSTQLQKVMMNVLPGPLRNPDVFKQLFGDPAMRRRIAEIIAARGISIPDHVLDRMSPSAMDNTFARASRLGLDSTELFTKIMAHPGLLARLQQPHVMAAFLDISEDPARQAKYEGDKELLEVVQKVREIMGTPRPLAVAAGTQPVTGAIELPPPPTASEEASVSTATPGGVISAGMPPLPGQPPQSEVTTIFQVEHADGNRIQDGSVPSRGAVLNPLVALMGSDPNASKWLNNPKVMAALEEVHQSPWKTVKYIFNRDVMEAFKDLQDLLRGKSSR